MFAVICPRLLGMLTIHLLFDIAWPSFPWFLCLLVILFLCLLYLVFPLKLAFVTESEDICSLVAYNFLGSCVDLKCSESTYVKL